MVNINIYSKNPLARHLGSLYKDKYIVNNAEKHWIYGKWRNYTRTNCETLEWEYRNQKIGLQIYYNEHSTKGSEFSDISIHYIQKELYEEYCEQLAIQRYLNNLKEERNEYAKLCSGKSKKFKLYTEWEAHIKELLADFCTPQDLYNFKRHCINADRSQEKAPEMFIAYIGLLIPLYLDTFWDGMPVILAPIFLVAILAYAIIQNKKLAKESYFFKDIIDVIESLEKDIM